MGWLALGTRCCGNLPGFNGASLFQPQAREPLRVRGCPRTEGAPFSEVPGPPRACPSAPPLHCPLWSGPSGRLCTPATSLPSSPPSPHHRDSCGNYPGRKGAHCSLSRTRKRVGTADKRERPRSEERVPEQVAVWRKRAVCPGGRRLFPSGLWTEELLGGRPRGRAAGVRAGSVGSGVTRGCGRAVTPSPAETLLWKPDCISELGGGRAAGP